MSLLRGAARRGYAPGRSRIFKPTPIAISKTDVATMYAATEYLIERIDSASDRPLLAIRQTRNGRTPNKGAENIAAQSAYRRRSSGTKSCADPVDRLIACT